MDKYDLMFTITKHLAILAWENDLKHIFAAVFYPVKFYYWRPPILTRHVQLHFVNYKVNRFHFVCNNAGV